MPFLPDSGTPVSAGSPTACPEYLAPDSLWVQDEEGVPPEKMRLEGGGGGSRGDLFSMLGLKSYEIYF